jgi:membrane-associated phospholipid phosphatase
VTLARAVSWPVVGAVTVAALASYLWLDRPLALASRGLPAGAVAALEVVTWFGRSTWYLVVAALAYLFFRFLRLRARPRSIAAFAFGAIAGSGILVNIIKFVLARARPVQLFDRGDFSWHFFEASYAKNSFPSGHADTITALALVLATVAPPNRLLRGGLVFVVLAVALSRVALTHHYLSDVIAGVYLAVVTTLWLRDFMERRGHRLRPRTNR